MTRVNKSLVAYREALAVEMAVQGLTFDEIAKELGYASRSGPWRAVRRALIRRTDEAADRYLSRSLVDLELIQQRAWPAAMNGDIHAAKVALGAIVERCRLLGI